MTSASARAGAVALVEAVESRAHLIGDGAVAAVEEQSAQEIVGGAARVEPAPQRLVVERACDVWIEVERHLAARYAGAGEIRMVDQYYLMSRARSFKAWRLAPAMRAIASTNYIYADATGQIALFHNASLPHRSAGHDWSGCVPGDTSATLWAQSDWAEPPALIAPSSGWLYSANGTPFSATDQNSASTCT